MAIMSNRIKKNQQRKQQMEVVAMDGNRVSQSGRGLEKPSRGRLKKRPSRSHGPHARNT